MDEISYLDKRRVLRASSIIENAAYVLDGQDKTAGLYTDVYSMRCRSCQSQNCPQARAPGLSNLEQGI